MLVGAVAFGCQACGSSSAPGAGPDAGVADGAVAGDAGAAADAGVAADAGPDDTALPEVLRLVPGGTYPRGCDAVVTPGCASDELPKHDVQVSSFEIHETEVQQAYYAECVTAGACEAPPQGYSPSATPRHPVVNVSWFDARDYCQWRGLRLPTEAEWEVAARGDDERIYPWGDAPPTCALAVMLGCGEDDPIAVGTRALGASPFGLLDMAGNAVEWVSDNYDGTFYQDYVDAPTLDPTGPTGFGAKVFRGGSVRYDTETPLGSLRASERYVDGATARYGDLGFRCARDVP